MAKQADTSGILAAGSRRHFGRQLALGALGFCTGLASNTAAPQDRLFTYPLLTAMQRSLGDATQVALLWWTMATQAQRAADTFQCSLGRRPLAEMELDPVFLASIDQDARQFHQLPAIQRNYVQPWAQAAEAAIQSLPQIEQARWRLWLNADVAPPVFNSLRAEELILSWGQASWPIDPRSGLVVVAPMLQAANALRQLAMHDTVTRLLGQLDRPTAQWWQQLRPVGQLNLNSDRPWLQTLAARLQQLAPALANAFIQTADQQWPERATWLQGPFGAIPVQCGFVARGVVAAPVLAADFVPVTLNRYCS